MKLQFHIPEDLELKLKKHAMETGVSIDAKLFRRVFADGLESNEPLEKIKTRMIFDIYHLVRRYIGTSDKKTYETALAESIENYRKLVGK